MRTGLLSLLLASFLVLESCTSSSCEPCPDKRCTIPDKLVGLTHADAWFAISNAGFTVHPHCHLGGGGASCHDSTGECDGWVDKVFPESGSYPCNTVIDLTFTSIKPAIYRDTESRPANPPRG